MAVYFWYAERDEKSETEPHLNQASGLVHGNVDEAYRRARQDAREDLEYLGITKGFTIKKFEKVGE